MPLPEPHLRPRKSEFLGLESGQVGFMGPQRVQFHGILHLQGFNALLS